MYSFIGDVDYFDETDAFEFWDIGGELEYAHIRQKRAASPVSFHLDQAV
jgi:hypothetical protein